MLRSILISLKAETSSPILGPLGRPAQAWFLGQLTHSHASLANRLHDEQGLKPYTVSSLLDECGRSLRVGSWLDPEQPCLLRITSLNEELSEALQKEVVSRLHNQLILYRMNFRVDGVYTKHSEYKWAGESSFKEIAQGIETASAGNHVRMEFVSPQHFEATDWISVCHLPGKYLEVYGKSGMPSPPDPCKSMNSGPSLQVTAYLLTS